MSNSTSTGVQEFMNKFLTRRQRKAAEAVRERLLFWIQRANSPEHYAGDDAPRFLIAELRRKARQNVRRIISQHPEIAEQIAAEIADEEEAA